MGTEPVAAVGGDVRVIGASALTRKQLAPQLEVLTALISVPLRRMRRDSPEPRADDSCTRNVGKESLLVPPLLMVLPVGLAPVTLVLGMTELVAVMGEKVCAGATVSTVTV